MLDLVPRSHKAIPKPTCPAHHRPVPREFLKLFAFATANQISKLRAHALHHGQTGVPGGIDWLPAECWPTASPISSLADHDRPMGVTLTIHLPQAHTAAKCSTNSCVPIQSCRGARGQRALTRSNIVCNPTGRQPSSPPSQQDN